MAHVFNSRTLKTVAGGSRFQDLSGYIVDFRIGCAGYNMRLFSKNEKKIQLKFPNTLLMYVLHCPWWPYLNEKNGKNFNFGEDSGDPTQGHTRGLYSTSATTGKIQILTS